MDVYDDELRKFEAEGAPPLPVPDEQGDVENEGARIWYSTYGAANGDFFHDPSECASMAQKCGVGSERK
jgi:hypothetical protein